MGWDTRDPKKDNHTGWVKVENDLTMGPLGLLKWLLVILVIIGSIVGVFKYTSTVTDRVVMKNSFQYKEGMAQKAAILQASIVEIEILMERQPENYQPLSLQKMILTTQLRAITINE